MLREATERSLREEPARGAMIRITRRTRTRNSAGWRLERRGRVDVAGRRR